MKVPELVNRLMRDLKTESAGNLSLAGIQEMNGAINKALQELHDLAPVSSKKTKTVLAFTAPKTISIGVVNGSTDFTVFSPLDEDFYCTVLIDGDSTPNEIAGDGVLLLPYAGSTGTKSATLWHDSIRVPSDYQEIIFPLVDVSDRDSFLSQGPVVSDKRTGEPEWAWVSDNASSRNPDSPMVLSVNTLPGSLYRYQLDAILAPPRITIADMTDSSAVVPMRYEHIESRLIPVIRGELATTEMWKNPETRKTAIDKGEKALAGYQLVPQVQSTPDNRVGTPYGF